MSNDPDDLARRLLRAQSDQGEAGAEAMGRLAGTLYQSLVEKCPQPLAATLTRDWFYLQLSRVLWPDQLPGAMFWDTQEGGEE